MVAAFLRDQLKLEASAEKSKVSKASDGTVFLGYGICTVSGGRVKRVRFQGRYTLTRSATSRIRLVVPHDRVVRFNRRKGYGDLSRLKAIHRRYLVDSSVLEIVLAYNAEMRGLTNITDWQTAQSTVCANSGPLPFAVLHARPGGCRLFRSVYSRVRKRYRCWRLRLTLIMAAVSFRCD